jgi:hypothetical protein
MKMIILTACVVTMALGAPALCLADSFSYPESDEGKVVKAYIEAFNSGVDSLVTGFHLAHQTEASLEEQSINDRLWEYQNLHKIVGALKPHSLVHSKGSVIIILVQSEKLESWFQLGFTFDDQAPGRLVDNYLRPAAKPKS